MGRSVQHRHRRILSFASDTMSSADGFDDGILPPLSGECDCDVLEYMSEDDRALRLLMEAHGLYEEMNVAAMNSAKAANVEKVAELTGVQPAILLYASRHGVMRAHKMFLKKEFQSNPARPGSPVSPTTVTSNING